MLSFSNLDRLSHHHQYLSALLGQQQFFFVGGMIRDLLLDRETNMDDVDVTMAGEPKSISAELRVKSLQLKENFSFFDTEKYGTMTIIPKGEEILDPSGKILETKNLPDSQIVQELGTKNQELGTKIQYEITPFRTETTYSDGRHPDEVVWSNSLLEDSQRRDFTINSMYYCKLSAPSVPLPPPSGRHDGGGPQGNLTMKTMLDVLEKQGRYFEEYSQTLIIQDHTLIEKSLKEGIDCNLFSLPQGGVGGLLLDPHHGIQDLVSKKIRCVGTADQRFQEDALRLIRGLRFAIALECDLHKDTRNSLKKNAYLIRQVAKERIKQELDKVFKGNNPFGFVALLDEANMLKRIFPKLTDNQGVNQPVRYHPFDVYTHSMMVLYHAQRLSDDYLLRYAALYHDVGKVEQYSSYNMDLDQDGIREMFGSRLNHPVCGAEFTRLDFRALGFSNKEIEQIERLVRRHMKPGEILNGDEKSQRKKIRALIAEVGPEMTKKVCLLTIADRLGQYNPIQAPEIESVYGLMALVDTLMAEEGRFTMKQLAVDGNFLMKTFDMTPSPALGVLLQDIFERVCDNIADRNDKVVIVEWVRQNKKVG